MITVYFFLVQRLLYSLRFIKRMLKKIHKKRSPTCNRVTSSCIWSTWKFMVVIILFKIQFTYVYLMILGWLIWIRMKIRHQYEGRTRGHQDNLMLFFIEISINILSNLRGYIILTKLHIPFFFGQTCLSLISKTLKHCYQSQRDCFQTETKHSSPAYLLDHYKHAK